MPVRIINQSTGENIDIEEDLLSLEGYVAFLITQGYDVPKKYHVALDAASDGDSVVTAKPQVPQSQRSVERTPGGQPIYGNVNTAENAIHALYKEKMERARREQPALFPQNPDERQPGPAEQKRDAKWVPPHRRETYMENAWSAGKIRAGTASIDKKLNLSAVLRDRSVQERFRVTDAQLNLVQILMQVSVEKAAIKATEILRDNGFRVLVVADMNSVSKAAARAALASAANAVGEHLRSREVPMIYLPGSTLVSMTPRPQDVSDDDVYTWEMTGPGREFVTMAAVWVLIQHYGPFETASRFGGDYGFLRIMITTIDRHTERADTLSPGMEYHAGDRSLAWATMVRDTDNEIVDLDDVDIGCVPFTTTGGLVVATAPVVDETWATVPYHVLKTPSGKIDAEAVEKADVRRVNGDLFAVALKTPRVAMSAGTRAPKHGEHVRLRLVDGDGSGRATRAVTTSCGSISVGAHGVHVIGLTATAGASGAVYVAASDGAVVGMHDGSDAAGMRMIPYINDLRAVLHAPIAWFAGGGPTTTRVLSPVTRFWARNKVSRTAWLTLAQRVGTSDEVMTLRDASVVRKACSVDDGSPSPGSWHRVPTSATPLSRVYRAERLDSDVTPQLYLRSGVDGESVVVLCCDKSGLFVSSEIAFGTESVASQENHLWAGQLVEGALVVAVKDVAIVGAMTRVPFTSDWVTFRVSGMSTSTDTESSAVSRGTPFGPSQVENRAWLVERFPFLNVHTYDSGILDECFTHSSCGQYLISECVFAGYQNLARIGDAIMKARFHVFLRKHGADPQVTTRLVGQWQNNEVQAVTAEYIGLTSQIRRASRLTTIGVHGFADALEALAAVVYIHESEVILDKFLQAVAMFGDN